MWCNVKALVAEVCYAYQLALPYVTSSKTQVCIVVLNNGPTIPDSKLYITGSLLQKSPLLQTLSCLRGNSEPHILYLPIKHCAGSHVPCQNALRCSSVKLGSGLLILHRWDKSLCVYSCLHVAVEFHCHLGHILSTILCAQSQIHTQLCVDLHARRHSPFLHAETHKARKTYEMKNEGETQGDMVNLSRVF